MSDETGPFLRGDHVELAHRLIAEDVVTHDGGEVRPVTDEIGAYHAWDPDSGLWAAVTDDVNECRVDDFAGAPVKTGPESEPRPLKLREGDAPAVVRVMRRQTRRRGFFTDDLVALENGLVAFVDADAIAVEEIRPHHGARAMLSVVYDGRWDLPDDTLLAQYLRTTFDSRAERMRLHEIMGAALFGLGPTFKKAWFLVDGEDIDGKGGTGKSTFLRLLEALVPDERCCSIPPQMFSDEYYGAELFGTTLNVVFETPEASILREDGVKAIIHGETITRRPIRGTPLEFAPVALHVFATNRLPDCPGATGAFWDRWEVIEFNRRFRGTDDVKLNLADRILADEYHHLVHLAIRGAGRALSQGGYTNSEAGAGALARWRHAAEPVASFVAERCEIHPSDSAADWPAASDIYQQYQRWCESVGRTPCGKRKFGRRLASVSNVKKEKVSSNRYSVKVLERGEREKREKAAEAKFRAKRARERLRQGPREDAREDRNA